MDGAAWRDERAWSLWAFLGMGARAFGASAVVAFAVAAVVFTTQGGGPAVPTPTPTPTPGPGLANLWIDGNGGTCTFHPSTVAYGVADGLGTGDATSCSSTGAAYAAANAASALASTVAIKAGSYGDQDVPGSGRTGGYITFVEDGGDVTFTSAFEMHADKTQWVGMTTSKNISVVPASTGDTSNVASVVFDGWSARGSGTTCTTLCDAAFYFKNVNGLTYKNGDICCGRATASIGTKAIQNEGSSAANVTFDNVTVHDWGRTAGDIHTECALIDGVNGLIIRNSRFWNCPVYDISLARVGGSPDPVNTLFENNIFEQPDDLVLGDRSGFYTMSLGHVTTKFDGLVIRNNSFDAPPQLFGPGDAGTDTPAGAYVTTSFYSNVVQINPGGCSGNGSTAGTPAWDGNVFGTTTCGTNAVSVGPASATSLFANRTGHDFHIGSGSAAIGAGATSNSAATDIGGNPRDGDPDAGAYEFGSGS